MKGRRNEHFWVFMGHDTETKVEYGYCERCKKYRYHPSPDAQGFTFITKTFFLNRIKESKVKDDNGLVT